MTEDSKKEDFLVRLDKKTKKFLQKEGEADEGRLGVPGVSLLVFAASIPLVLALAYIVVGFFQFPDELISTLPQLFKIMIISAVVFVILGISVTKSSYNLLRGVRKNPWAFTIGFIVNMLIFALLPEESPSLQELFSFDQPFIYLIIIWLSFAFLQTNLVKTYFAKNKFSNNIFESILVILSLIMGLSAIMFILIDGASILGLIVDYL